MNRRFRAIGFDLGDTLLAYRGVPLNWASLYDEALRAVAVRCGAVPTAEGFASARAILSRFNTRLTPRTHEVGAGEIFGLILSSWGMPQPESVAAAIEAFFAFFQQRLTAYEDTVPVLETLRRRKIPIGVLTDVPYGMPRQFVERDLRDGGISGLIDVLLTSVDAGVRKPEAAGYIVLAERLGVAPSETLYVGNESKDVIGAARAGLGPALIDRTGQKPDHGQQFTISTLHQLPDLVAA